MIDLHYWPTPNGWKISIYLEEAAIPYRVVPVDIGKGQQFEPGFLAISPNNRMPAIVDHAPADGGAPISVFESGAILEYLSEKTGVLRPDDLRTRVAVSEWLFWQMAGLGPMMGQANHFRHYAAGKSAYGEERYVREVARLFGVMERRLVGRDYLAGPYSIADIACFSWARGGNRVGIEWSEFPRVKDWHDRIAARPAVARGLLVGKDWSRPSQMSEEQRRILFAQGADGKKPD
jgi:GST-like protein